MELRRTRSPLFVTAALLSGLLASVSGGLAASAQADPGHTSLVPSRPRTDMIRVLDGVIYDSEVVGNRIVIGGTFTQIRDTNGVVVTQKYIAAYDKNTGALDLAFNAVLDKQVNDLSVAPDGSGVYLAGDFGVVDGVTRRKVAKLAANGDLVAGFKANADNRVSNVQATPTRVLLGGRFTTINSTARAGLAAVNPTTGALDTSFSIQLAAAVNYSKALTTVAFDVTADYSTLLVVHGAAQIGGQASYGVALVDLVGAPSVKPWRTKLYENGVAKIGYIAPTDGAISPDGSYIVVTSACGDNPPFCDSAVRFPTNVAGSDIQPDWVSRNFDSTYTVALSSQAAYIGGHLQYVEAPGSTEPWPGDTNLNYGSGVGGDGAITLGSEVVRREHIAALDLTTGKALPWAPGSDSFQGVQSLTTIPDGLLVGHDGSRLGGISTIGRHGFFDFRKVPAPDIPDSQIVDPFVGRLYAGGAAVVVNGTATTSTGRTITKVTLEVLDKSGLYLQTNGTFSTTFMSFTAVRANAAATTTWTHTLPVLPSGVYRINSRAADSTRAKEPVKATSSFTVRPTDTVVPTVNVTAPAYDKQDFTNNSVVIEGLATDNQSVERVEISLYRDATQEFLQGNVTAAAGYYSFDAVLATPNTTSTTYRLALDNLPNGKWTITIRVFDPAGLIGRSGTRFLMFPGDADPVVTVQNPTTTTSTQTGGVLQVSGIAADPQGVMRVEVYAYNAATGLFPGTDGVLAGPRWTPMSFNSPGSTNATFDWTSPSVAPGSYWVLIAAYDTAEKWNRTTYVWYSITVS